MQAARGKGFEALDWRVVEWSTLSSRMLQAMRPDLRVYEGPFERWVREYEAQEGGRIGLLLSNPPYGARGASITEDPNRDYREKRAYAYFLRRGLDLLAPMGLGVYLIPSGFLSGKGSEGIALRDKILKKHHLSAAYRLPSGIFPGALLVTDLLFFRARGLELDEVLEADRFILEGRYFEEYPEHILGKEVGKDGGDDDQTKKPRWGYQVVGDFERLPDLVEREMPEGASVEIHEQVSEARPSTDERLAASLRSPSKKTKASTKKAKSGGGVARTLSADTEGLEEAEARAVELGVRVDQYLAAASAQVNDLHVQLWPELHAALTSWAKANGNPHAQTGVVALWRKGNTAIERFLSAYTKTGALIPGLAQKPVWEPRFGGATGDVAAFAEWRYRAKKELSLRDLATAWAKETNQSEGTALGNILKQLPRLLSNGWCIDLLGESLPAMLYPEAEYLSGSLWPRYDRLKALLAKTDADRGMVYGALGTAVSREALASQAKKLLSAIKPALFEDIEDISPRYGWMPLSLVEAWANKALQGWRGGVELERHNGLVRLKDVAYEDLGEIKKEKRTSVTDETISFLGWLNHDFVNFKVSKRKHENLDEKRLEQAKTWEQSFFAWVSSDEERKEQVIHAYNRHFRGYVSPDYGAEPLPIARWTKEGVKLHPHQITGARRVLAHRGGMLAFDVGVGKTYTGIAVVARAKQEGWCKRPVILVPNSIAWKWYADLKRVLPNYRVAVIGSKRKLLARGGKKGHVTSDTDTAKERAAKWTRFQAGEFDVVLLTYTALGRTRMNEDALREYADSVEAIRRQIALRQRNASKSGKISERQEAVLKEGTTAWIAEKTELPESWEYDEGIAWDDIGVDLLVVDEAQNFKNLYMPEAREGGVPRFMGNAGEGSNRAWQLDFRCAAIRRHTGGTGIVLLSATPAKNSPLEFYNLLQLIDPQVWTRMGIYDPEQFIDRYLKIELRQVIGTNMDVADKSAVVGFKNLDELREVIFRYADFKTAEDVGLKLPEPTVNVIEVEMDAAQNRKYDDYVSQIEEALESKDMADKAQILGLMARMALVSIHAELDEGYDWKSAETADVEPESPKFKALAKRIKARTYCGHIVFCEPTAAHRWLVKTLVKQGIPEHRIAILNAVVAKNTADRARIAIEFNGDDENEPKYDVVIANQVAYEGIDLQRRTCEIHHIDLPWEPATLQQRNGRGVRQGNTLEAIDINYYFAKRSQDGVRFNLIQGKRGWMVSLIKSQDRDTNNPAAQMQMGPEEILLMISRNPEKTKERLEAVKAKLEEERRAKLREHAAKTLIAANARFRRAEKKTGEEAAQLRAEGEELLKDLSQIDPEAWPWLKWATKVREQEVIVHRTTGIPLYSGLRLQVKPKMSDNSLYIELGRPSEDGASIGYRSFSAGNSLTYRNAKWSGESIDALATMLPENFDAVFSEDADSVLHAQISQNLRWVLSDRDFTYSSWHLASNEFMTSLWASVGDRVFDYLTTGGSEWEYRGQSIPIEKAGRLVVAKGSAAREGRVIPPTLEGWRSFLALAPKSGLTYTEVLKAGLYWWGRKIPHNLMSKEETE